MRKKIITIANISMSSMYENFNVVLFTFHSVLNHQKQHCHLVGKSKLKFRWINVDPLISPF